MKRRIISLLYCAVVRRHPATTRACRNFLIPLALLSTLNSQLSTAFAQGTAFIYQGRLNDSGSPANGNYDLRFTIYDAVTNGNAVSLVLTNSPTAVSNGLFVANLDFGPGIFTGPARWLDIGVRTNGGANAFTNLVPRQPILAVPYAIFANTASNLLGTLVATQLTGILPSTQLNGTYSGQVNFNNGANSFNGAFSGNGTNLVNLNASQLTGGTVADARLTPNVALLNGIQTFTGSNVFTGSNIFTGINTFTGPNNSFSGNGTNLVNLNASQLTGGTVADARLSPNVPLLNTNQVFTGSNVFRGPGLFTGTNFFTGVNLFTNFGNSFVGSFFGNGLVGWLPTNGAAIQAVRDTGYLLTNSQQVTVTLPLSANVGVGDIVRISGPGASGWQVAQNAGQSILGNFSSFANSPWSMVQAANTWFGIASSADGTRLAAVASVNGISTSIDSGGTWTANSGLPAAQFHSIASSADGSRLVAAVLGGFIYTNSGTSWASTGFGTANWTSVASSADGTRLFAAASGGAVYSSTNSGTTWAAITGSANWISVACSADGSKAVAAISGGTIAASGGSTAPPANWISVTSSADGNKLAAAVGGGGIYTSSNAGASWTPQSGAPSTNWTSIDSSADGSKLVAVVNGGGIYASSNFGVTWVQQTNAPVRTWSSIASSADGTKLAAAVNNATTGGIFISQASSQTTTTVGTTGYIVGGQGAAVELQYIGNGQFMPVSSAGTIWAF
ncbi:MAG TPA: hypothetical protein VN836_05275 [Verrucomicrobiae bacterium]|nr:hypothetical protein [Verrucomicrobiae bacterium]